MQTCGHIKMTQWPEAPKSVLIFILLIITHKKSLAGNACLFKVVELTTVEWKQYALLLQTRRFSPPRWRHWWTIHVTIVDRILLQCQILRVGRYCHVMGAFLHVVTWPIGQLLLTGWPGCTLPFLGLDTRWILVVFMMISVNGNNFKNWIQGDQGNPFQNKRKYSVYSQLLIKWEITIN